jgi:hypothetical protein
MSQRYPSDAYIQTVEALVNAGLEVWVWHETYYGELTGWVIITAPFATLHMWTQAEKQHMTAYAPTVAA